MDEVNDNVIEATKLAEDFGDEARNQTAMIKNNNDHIDATNADMIVVTGKMTNLLAVSNQWCLWGIFAAEVVALVLMFVF